MSERINFGKIKEGAEPPNLIEIQLNSYVEFLQKDVPLSKRKDVGLQSVFGGIFPIPSYDEKVVLDLIKQAKKLNDEGIKVPVKPTENPLPT